MDDVYAYLTRLPRHINEIVVPCFEGYTVYIDDQLSDAARLDAFNHALRHIARCDFENGDVQEIEMRAHYG